MIRYFAEINGNKYLTLGPTNGTREKIKKYEELWIKIRDKLGQWFKIGWLWQKYKKTSSIQMIN